MSRASGRSSAFVVLRSSFVVLLLTMVACDSTTSPVAPTPPAQAEAPATPPTTFTPPTTLGPAVLQPPAAAPASSDPLVGRYLLEIVVGTTSGLGCERVPADVRRRTYTADIHEHGDGYAVKLYGAAFLSDAGALSYGCRDRRLPYDGACHMFLLTHDGESAVTATITSEDEWRGNEIWEVFQNPYRVLQVHGQATGAVRDGRIEATGTGGLWYGNGLPATEVSTCGPDIHLTFTRR